MEEEREGEENNPRTCSSLLPEPIKYTPSPAATSSEFWPSATKATAYKFTFRSPASFSTIFIGAFILTFALASILSNTVLLLVLEDIFCRTLLMRLVSQACF